MSAATSMSVALALNRLSQIMARRARILVIGPRIGAEPLVQLIRQWPATKGPAIEYVDWPRLRLRLEAIGANGEGSGA